MKELSYTVELTFVKLPMWFRRRRLSKFEMGVSPWDLETRCAVGRKLAGHGSTA